MNLRSKPTYCALWSRFTGRYEGFCSAHPSTVVTGAEAATVLEDLQKLMRLMG